MESDLKSKLQKCQEQLRISEDTRLRVEQQLDKGQALTDQKLEFLQKENRTVAEKAQLLQNENSQLREQINVISNSQSSIQNDADQS